MCRAKNNRCNPNCTPGSEEDEAPWNSMSRHISSSLIPTIKVLMITNRRTRVGGRPVNKTNTNMKRRNMAGGNNKRKCPFYGSVVFLMIFLQACENL